MSRTLAWFGAPFFASSLKELAAPLGWNLVLEPFLKPRTLTWTEICARAGTEPDVVVWGDNSCPPPFLGVENYPAFTVFYCVDSHIHSWHPEYGQCFDLCLVSLKDHISRFIGPRLAPEQVLWTPAFAKDTDAPRPAEKSMDLLFVGKVDPETTPKRHRFLSSVAERFPGLVVKQGAYEKLFPQARLVLNIAEHDDLNFRVFEALACESCLLTPQVAHGLEELFVPDQDLFLYEPDSVDSLLELVSRLLEQPEQCARAARSGRTKVDKAHRARHRAKAFLHKLTSLDFAALSKERRAHASHLHASFLKMFYLHWAETLSERNLAQRYYQEAMGRLTP